MNTWMIVITTCMACLSAFFSCTYGMTDEDWTKNGKVRLTLDWQGVHPPSRMVYYFYREGVACPVIRRAGSKGFEGTLPSGTYRVMVCNPGSRNILLETENGYEMANGMIKHVSVLKSSPSYLTCPNHLQGCGSDPLVVRGEEPATATLYPAGLVRTLELHIQITKGGREKVALSGLSGCLGGVSPGVCIPSGAALSGTPAFMAFEPECMDEGRYRALLTLFGLTDPATDGAESIASCLYLTLKGEGEKELTTSVGIPREVGEMFRRKKSSRVILDLVVAYDEVNGPSVSLEDWKEGTGSAGQDNGEIG